MSSVSFDIEVEAICEGCGGGLNVDADMGRFGNIIVTVEPCDTCAVSFEEEGRNEDG